MINEDDRHWYIDEAEQTINYITWTYQRFNVKKTYSIANTLELRLFHTNPLT